MWLICGRLWCISSFKFITTVSLSCHIIWTQSMSSNVRPCLSEVTLTGVAFCFPKARSASRRPRTPLNQLSCPTGAETYPTQKPTDLHMVLICDSDLITPATTSQTWHQQSVLRKASGCAWGQQTDACEGLWCRNMKFSAVARGALKTEEAEIVHGDDSTQMTSYDCHSSCESLCLERAGP